MPEHGYFFQFVIYYSSFFVCYFSRDCVPGMKGIVLTVRNIVSPFVYHLFHVVGKLRIKKHHPAGPGMEETEGFGVEGLSW